MWQPLKFPSRSGGGFFVTTAEIKAIILLVCVTGLVGYMGFTVVDRVSSRCGSSGTGKG